MRIKFLILFFLLLSFSFLQARLSLDKVIPSKLEVQLQDQIIKSEKEVKMTELFFIVTIDGEKSYIPIGEKSVNISQIFPKRKGKFTLKLRSNAIEMGDIEHLDIYFWSFVKSRKLLKTQYGSACNQYVKLKRSMVNRILGRGLKLNLQTVPYLMQGKFFIISETEEKFYLSTASLFDPETKAETCQWFKLLLKDNRRREV